MGCEINKSSVPRDAVKRVEGHALDTFKKLNNRNPTRQESERIIKTVHDEAAKLNKRQ
jgi:hypothetical protein